MSASESTLILQRMLTNMEFESGMWVTSWKKSLANYIQTVFAMASTKDESKTNRAVKIASKPLLKQSQKLHTVVRIKYSSFPVSRHNLM